MYRLFIDTVEFIVLNRANAFKKITTLQLRSVQARDIEKSEF